MKIGTTKKMKILPNDKVKMLQFPVLSEDCNISHFVTTRQGGVSKGAYASFNPGEYSGDNPEAVRANRKLLSDAIRIPSERIFAPFQVHGAEVRSIEPSFLSLPLEEQQPLKDALAKQNATILIQLVAPVSGKRIPEILKDAKGFVYCVSSMGVTGQGASFHKEVISYLKSVKEQAQIPIMMGFGIRTAADVAPMKDIIDGTIVGSHFINLMEENQYDLDVAKAYIQTFKTELK